MSIEFQELLIKVAKVVENRTVVFGNSTTHQKLAQRYDDGEYNPFFSIVLRDGELRCIWCQNRQKHRNDKGELIPEPELARFKPRPEGFGNEEWDALTLEIMHGLKLKL